MARAKIEYVTGEAVGVQLSSETHVGGGGRGKNPVVTSRIVNKMRVFLREDADGKERDHIFVNSTVGVREGHRLVIVRAHAVGGGGPIHLALINESTGQREEYESGFLQVGKRRRFFGARWRAAALSAIAFVVGYLVSRFLTSPEAGLLYNVMWPAFFAILAFPVFWAAIALWHQLTDGPGAAEEARRVRAEIAARLTRVRNDPPPAPPAQR